MKRNADNKHPPNFLQSPKLEERRPPSTAAGEGSCPRPPPAPRPEPRNAGSGARSTTPPRSSPRRPLPGRGHPQLRRDRGISLPSLPSQSPPAAPAAGSVTGHRNAAAPGTPAGAPDTLCQDKNPSGPASLRCHPPCPPVKPQHPSGAKSLFIRSKLGVQTALPRGPGFTLQGEENYSPFYSQLHRSSRVGEPRSADPVGGRCGTRGHSPRRSHAGGSGVKAAGAASPAGEGMEPDTAHGHSFRGPTSSGTPRASTERNINFPALSVVAKSLET